MHSTIPSHDNLADDVVVVKKSSNSEAATVGLAHSTCYFADTLNSQLFTTLIWRGNEHLNPNITSDRRARCAANKCAVERNIVCKSALCTFGGAVIPVEDDG
jgi:hypothetical protein